MLNNFHKVLLIPAAVLGFFLVILPSRAQQPNTMNDVFRRAVFNSSGTYYDLTDISGQANMMFGWRTWPGSFPENQISEDAQTTEFILQDALRQQSGEAFRTRDLVNPFDTSIQQNPSYIRPSQ